MPHILGNFAADDLLRLNRLLTLGQLVRGAAHNLNNSLQAIAGAAELLGGRTDLPEAAVRMIGRISNQSARATAVVNDLVTLTRTDGAAAERVDLREIVSRAVGLRQNALSRSQIHIAQTDDAGGSALVRGNAAQLQLAVLNLLLNAEQALAGQANGEIQIGLERHDEALRLVLADNGPGIPVDQRERIFEPFFSTGAPGAAAGLGLTVARAIAESSGGRLLLDASATPGARFVMELPDASCDR